MLNKNTFMNAVGFAEALAANNVKAAALPNTVIYELVRLSNPEFFNQKLDNEQSLDLFADSVQLATQSDHGNLSAHSAAIDGYIQDISQLVSNHISYAKNSVVPVINDFSEKYRQFRESISGSEVAKYNVVKLCLPSILKDESFLEVLKPYKNRKPLQPSKSFFLKTDKTDEELLALVSIGHNRTDKLIHEWLGQFNPEFLSHVWQSFFVNSKGAATFKFQDIEKRNVFERCDVALAMFLISNKLFNDVQDAEGMDLNTYKRIMAEYRDYSGSVLTQAIDRIVYFTKAKTLVVEALTEPYTVKVNGELYDPWLDNGGDSDVILGLAVSGSDVRNLDLINENAQKYKNQWNSYVAFLSTKEKNESVLACKRWIEGEVYSGLKTLDDTEKEYINSHPTYMDTVKKLLAEELDMIKSKDLEDVDLVSLRIIGKVRFFYTCAYEILSDMLEASKVNPDIDPREAALFAAINYVADYVADQITLAA